MILNPDGTPYRLSGSLNQFDPASQDINLLNTLDAEITEISGSPVFYYEVFIQVNNTVDMLYREDRGKMWSPIPIQLFATYDPVASQNYQNMFGIDGPDEIQLEFNYRDVLQRLGKPPKVGSRIFTPHLRENWEIVQRNLAEFKLWSTFKLQLICKRFQDDVVTNAGRVDQPQPNFRIDDGIITKNY